MNWPLKTLARAVGERFAGDGPGPLHAALAAAITGTATAAITYKALRSGD